MVTLFIRSVLIVTGLLLTNTSIGRSKYVSLVMEILMFGGF